VLLKYLIKELNYQKALYLDCDLFFYNSFDFLFEKLNDSRAILTPHWRSTDPNMDSINFQDLLQDGLYNGGFIGVNKEAIEILDWWAMVCEYSCVKQKEKGYFDDQGYLNILPVKFDAVEIIKHRGCNLASWNQLECKRTLNEKGEVLINNNYPVVFIHFTDGTIKAILNGEDSLLKPHLEKYSLTVSKYNPAFDLIAKYNLLMFNSGRKEKRKGFKSAINKLTRKKN
jgi:lipopolysaccharide biosynthesis glycosyltransferase